jgi:hypothetical protein
VFVDKLLEDDEFLDAIARATSIVGRDASRAKWALLQNPLFNTAVDPDALSADKRAIHLRYLSELTVTHVQVMALFHDTVGFLESQGKPWPDVYMGSFHSIVQAALPQLAADTNLFESVIADLSAFGLISSPGMGTTMTAEGLRQRRSTSKGSEFAIRREQPVTASYRRLPDGEVDDIPSRLHRWPAGGEGTRLAVRREGRPPSVLSLSFSQVLERLDRHA